MARAHWPWHSSAPRSDTPPVDADEITELLDKVRQLRMTLTADLSAAAGAIDAEQPDVARDIIAADRIEVRRLAERVIPPQRPTPTRRRRALIALPAIPLVGALAVTGAAALTGGSSNHPDSTAAGRSVVATIDTPATIQQTAATTLHHLERVVAERHHPRQVVTVAAHLHHQLSAIIATAPHDALQLGEVRRLLSVEQQLLESHHGEATAIALAASRQLNDLLAAAGLPTARPSSIPTLPVTPTQAAPTTPTPTPMPSKPTKPHPSKTPTNVVGSPTAPSHSPTPSRHAHHHRHHLTNPLFGTGLLSEGL